LIPALRTEWLAALLRAASHEDVRFPSLLVVDEFGYLPVLRTGPMLFLPDGDAIQTSEHGADVKQALR